MSYTRVDLQDDDLERPQLMPFMGRLARIGVWSILNVGLLFAETVSEFLAPICLLAGGLWWALPRILNAITLEGQAAELMTIVRSRVPHDIYLDGSYYSAGSLISYGLWLFGVVALCRTLSVALSSLLLDRR